MEKRRFYSVTTFNVNKSYTTIESLDAEMILDKYIQCTDLGLDVNLSYREEVTSKCPSRLEHTNRKSYYSVTWEAYNSKGELRKKVVVVWTRKRF